MAHSSRYRQAGKTALASAVARAISIGTALLVVPLALNYLGAERYGLWLTLSSFLALLGFMDLGIGNAVMTGVSRTGSGTDKARATEVVSTGFVLLTATAAIGAIIVITLASVIDVSSVLGLETANSAEVGPTLAVLVAVLLINLPLGLAGKTQWGLQRGYISSLWQAAGSALSVAMLLVVIRAEAGLPWLAVALTGATAIAALANTVVMFTTWGQWLRPRVHRITAPAASELAKLGGLFLGLQMAVVVAFASDNLVVAKTLGVEAVPDLAVPFKMFAFVPMMLAFVLGPLWPAYGDAIASQDFHWVRRTLIRSLVLATAASGVFALGLVILGNTLLDLWTGGQIMASTSLLLALAAWVILSAVGGAVSMLLNGGAVIRFQLMISWSMALCAVGLKLMLVPRIGVSGAIWATVISYGLLVIIPYGIYVPRYLQRLETSERALSSVEGPVGDSRDMMSDNADML